MKRLHKLLLFYSVLALLLADTYVIMRAFQLNRGEPVDFWKVSVAAIAQGLAIGVCVLYAIYLARAKPIDTRLNVILDALRIRLAPIFLAVILAAFSVTLLKQAIQCGSQPFPSNRGALLCGRS